MSEDDILVLEHAIGGRRFLQCHPTQKNLAVHSIGSACVISNLDDVHDQIFLRRHTEEISAIAVSEHFIATGQYGKRGVREAKATVCVWRLKDNSLVYELDAHLVQVLCLAFSPDERFLATGGADCLMAVWDMKTGKQLGTFKSDKKISCLSFAIVEGEAPTPTRSTSMISRKPTNFVRSANPIYRLFMGSGTSLKCFDITFSISSQSYVLNRPEAAGLPSTGFVRTYPTCTIIGDDVISGTDSGEIVIYSLKNKIYRTHKRACSGSVMSFCEGEKLPDCNQLVVGGGHGVIVIFEGSDTSYEIVDVIELPCQGDVTSLSSSTDDSLVCLTTKGTLYRLTPNDDSKAKHLYRPSVLLQMPCYPTDRVCFPPNNPDVCAVSSYSSVSLWDLSNYTTLYTASFSTGSSSAGPAAPAIAASTSAAFMASSSTPSSSSSSSSSDLCSLSVGILPHREVPKGVAAGSSTVMMPPSEVKQKETVVCGFKDGSIRAIDSHTGDMLWKISAHRGSTSTLCISRGMMLSGGDDGCVRCWSGRTQETLAEFKEHNKSVTSVLFDVEDQKLAHSCSLDKTIATYDLAEETKVNSHITQDEIFLCMDQRRDGEKELITGSLNGVLSIWDCDVPDSVCSVLTGKESINSLSISPSGRMIALCNEGGDVLLYDMRQMKIVLPPVSVLHAGRTISKPRPAPSYQAPSFSSNGGGHSYPANYIAWAPDEKQVISVGDDCGIFIWNYYG